MEVLVGMYHNFTWRDGIDAIAIILCTALVLAIAYWGRDERQS